MNQADVKVSFYLKKSEADAKGNCPVMARLNVGKYSEAAFSVKMSVPHTMWHSGRATGKSVAAREINRQLDEIRASALHIYQEQSAIREGVTAEDVKCLLLGMASGQQTYLSQETHNAVRRFLSVVAPNINMSRYIDKIVNAHLEQHRDEMDNLLTNEINNLLNNK